MDSSNRFSVHYLITAQSGAEADERAENIAIEQTSELPEAAIPDAIRKHFTGKVVICKKTGDNLFEAVISYPLTVTGNEITQCLNMLFGNISLKSGIRISGIGWHSLTEIFPGPKFGIGGIRDKLNIYDRPITCTALKPVGLSSKELAERCYLLAKGGLDIIKDDHGLANQSTAPFSDRLEACLKALERAADVTGKKTAYIPNITGDCFETWRRFEIAQELGAFGVLIAPQLTGMSSIKSLTDTDSSIPVMVHPTFSGSFVMNSSHGFTPEFYYGHLWRALGADAVIYPNAGGRFTFTEKQCKGINDALRYDASPFKTAFPVPGGGIKRNTLTEWIDKYGKDTIFLIGGSLYLHEDGLETAAKEFQDKIDNYG
jgi:ribulose-bisphosphate carboxylase large chain